MAPPRVGGPTVSQGGPLRRQDALRLRPQGRSPASDHRKSTRSASSAVGCLVNAASAAIRGAVQPASDRNR
jgi:hypothetical protein